MPSLKAAVVSLSTMGVIVYGSRGSLGLFIEPWERAFGQTRGAVSLIGAVGFISFGIAQPIAGRLLETKSARLVIAVGLALMALGYGLSAFAPNVWVALLAVGGVASFGTGLASLSALSYVAGELVTDRQGLVFGVLTAAGAGGQVFILPLATAALEISLPAALLTLASLAASAAVASLIWIPPIPLGDPATLVGRGKAMLAAPNFWRLAVPFFVCGFTTTGLIDTHFIPYARDNGISTVVASSALATLAAFNVFGVLVAGSITDRIDRSRMLVWIYLARGGALALLPFITNPVGIFVFAAMFGLADFSTVPPTTSLTRTSFPAGWGFALGIIAAGHQLGSAAGAALGGWSHDLTGGYLAILFGSAALLSVAAAMSRRIDDDRTNTPSVPVG